MISRWSHGKLGGSKSSQRRDEPRPCAMYWECEVAAWCNGRRCLGWKQTGRSLQLCNRTGKAIMVSPSVRIVSMLHHLFRLNICSDLVRIRELMEAHKCSKHTTRRKWRCFLMPHSQKLTDGHVSIIPTSFCGELGYDSTTTTMLAVMFSLSPVCRWMWRYSA